MAHFKYHIFQPILNTFAEDRTEMDVEGASEDIPVDKEGIILMQYVCEKSIICSILMHL